MSGQVLIYNRKAPKEAVNLRINSELLLRARRLNINLSQVFEEQLVGLIRKIERDRWVTEDRDTIEAYNKRYEKEDVFAAQPTSVK